MTGPAPREPAAAAPVLRFAPSPNGRLHLGHAYSALLNADLARRMGGTCRLRIEDIDPVRSRPELTAAIVSDLAWLGLRYPEPVRHQSRHMDAYRAARDRLVAAGLAYPCFCSRGAIRAAASGEGAPRDPDGAPLYPGTCRALDPAEAAARRARPEPHTWRLDMARALAAAPGPHGYRTFDAEGRDTWATADPARWGDAVIARRDVPTSYHLAVVHDDAAEGISHVVRGRDLEAATDLHALLQRLLGLPSPAYHHHALILDAAGEKLAKSRGSTSLADLRAAGAAPADVRARLGFP
ncbi:tRNA glutamyl-Q(34) synthetase GluQRS [Methylobacterium sp. NEAU 140]|uniref:tRNA glutamyl-Q(34) synthetase GluQRS n=1 Tax=Methylobacterium sp. NEAU 140 TaxID=3064945 RepID=UPI002733AD9B|nr:tRNA glutamyl-Q(34) synthetase GluQRS [Methylobacterium sp. NEAU 140]MDP4024291.1 tRNA glutamyl-Q(34) synthetase GluQRS [Methylobacterium sp. NEAU 140]